ncbi:hypothetical protein [Acidovorax sp. CCYZU-2555]|uniref:hypothetical protein n=1 Tax=Acidovorax sp. CCYZU-2555 TaxID=2835042 RepID=UPI001BCB57CB|nr:hypothetical protein [Acidovorax sp. CCYZU-2555]MBS7778746.1 hypothetical protein [Acidovorax sp. CCYZU-2555]
MSSATQHPRKYTDESFVLKATAIGVVCVAIAGYLVNRHLEAKSADEKLIRAQGAVYKEYLNNTPPQEPKPLSEAMAARLKVRDQLLANPAVKPGPGFAAPGVQSTGKAIIDAIDRVQGRSAATL